MNQNLRHFSFADLTALYEHLKKRWLEHMDFKAKERLPIVWDEIVYRVDSCFED